MLNKNKTKKAESAPAKKSADSNTKNGSGIIGLLLLLVVLSIAYSSYVVWFGTTGVMPKVYLAPQMIFVAAVLVWKFNR